MSDNNMMYQMYKQMILGNKLGKDGENLFEHSVKCWFDLNPDNPFQENSEAFEHFFRMQNYYNCWKMNGADKKINLRRLLNEAKDLCALKVKNPYKFDKKAAEEEKANIKENAAKAHEDYLKSVQEAERQKAERDEEIRQIMEELNNDNAESQKRINDIKKAANEIETKYNSANSTDKNLKYYVFNSVERPDKELDSAPTSNLNKKKRRGLFHRLLKR